MDDEVNGVLGDTGGLDTTGIDILGASTSHVDVSLPVQHDDDEYADDETVDDGYVVGESVSSLEDGAEVFHGDVEGGEADGGEVASEHLEIAREPHEDIHTADIVIELPSDAPLPDSAAEIAAPPSPQFEGSGWQAAGSVTVEPQPIESEIEETVDEEKDAPVPIAQAPVAAQPVGSTPAPAPAVREQSRQEVVRPLLRHDITLASKRLGDLNAAGRETPDLLTADRLLEHKELVQPEPEGVWRHLLYALSGRRINLGDSKRARDRKILTTRIAEPLVGGARFVPVLSRKGGVGKTTVTTLLGMALADARDDRIIAVDANPDRGTLADRIARPSGKTVRDLVRARSQIFGYNDISNIVARDETRLDILASDTDPHVSEAFSDVDYREVAQVAAHYYSIVLTDTGTGIVHSVMGATLDLADQLVIVAGLSIDEARLASETLTWLEANGYIEQVRNAVVVLNQASPGAPVVRLDEVQRHFESRVRDVVRIPYDPLIAAGSAISFRDLQPATRLAARSLAAKVVEGLRGQPAAAA
ncbi:AAA family ATPase [Micromonospora sp. DT81.3]|uniref:MinD/ParA family ATP-binding protein n=1 Tax=Micromonospora sp. DT81.3 TaxID=3416523 RepID=UPI003CEC6535